MSQPHLDPRIRAIIDAVKQQEHDLMQERLIVHRYIRGSLDGRGSGPFPYGYIKGDWNEQLNDADVEVDPKEALVINLIFQLAGVGVSPKAIAWELNLLGYRSSRDCEGEVISHQILYQF